LRDPTNVLAGIETDIRQHGGQEDVWRRSQPTHGNTFPLEITDGAYPFGPEQLKTTDMD
jgi:hypothetical protein